MKQRCFTQEEMDVLRANPCTYSVTPNRLEFTEDFKKKFWEDYSAGKSPKAIFVAVGYDPEVIGLRRIEHFSKKMRETFSTNKDYYNGLRDVNLAASTGDSIMDKRLKEMDNQLRLLTHKYSLLQQEMDFLKKTYLAVTSRKP